LKILHIIESLGVGGAEKLLVAVINGMTGFEHHIMILEDPETLRADLRSGHAFLNLGITSKFNFLSKVRKVKAYIKNNHIDIVHAHLYKANVLSRIATPKNIPLYNSIHAISSLAAYEGSWLALAIERATYKRRTHIIGVSHEVLKDFDKHVGLKGPSTVLYNFIEEVFFRPAPKTEFSSDCLKLVAVGNLRKQKNYPYLVEAFRYVPPNVSLDIYGEGSLFDELQQQINEYKVNIRLRGLHSAMYEVLPDYDAFVMSSFYEGQPLSLLEAMAIGLPSLLSDIPVLKEVAANEALFFDINDHKSLGRQVEKLLKEKTLLPKLAAASHKRVNEFAHSYQYLDKLASLYAGGLTK
jgi:L-malate glycosyltransferase